jgi:hypothetical protein
MKIFRLLTPVAVLLLSKSGLGQVTSPYKVSDRSFNWSYKFETTYQSGYGASSSSNVVSAGASCTFESPLETETELHADYLIDADLSVYVKWPETWFPPESVEVTLQNSHSRAASVHSGIGWGEPQNPGPISDASGAFARSTLFADIGPIKADALSMTIGTATENSLWGRGDSQNLQAIANIITVVELQGSGPVITEVDKGKYYKKRKYVFKGSRILGKVKLFASAVPIANPWISFDVSSGSSLLLDSVGPALSYEAIR